MKHRATVGTLSPVAVVTGAGSGIGAATAQRFSREGWDVILIGRRIEPLNKVAAKMTPKGVVFALDISKPDAKAKANAWLKKNPDIASRIKAVVHNAGIVERASTLNSTDQSWHQTFETNVFGVIRLTQALFPFLKQNKGSVVNVASTLGLRPIVDTAAYSASKAALINWTLSFAKEVGPDGVRVNCVCPGIVDTPIQAFHSAKDRAKQIKALAPMQPLGRIGQPDDVAHMIWSLAGPGAEWTTGAVLNVDGGINL